MHGSAVALLAALGCAAPLPACAERLWLLVGASDASAAALAQRARPLAAKLTGGLLIQTRDCGEAKNVFAWVAELADSAKEAQAALTNVLPVVPDAYVKRCDVKPRSLLALRIDAIDPSIAAVPAAAVNWREQDRVSTVQSLADGRSLLVTRFFVDDPNDPLEGRRERVSVIDVEGVRSVLQEQCVDVGRASVQRGDLVFQCAREQAGVALLHSVLAFDAAGHKVVEIEHCRNPRWQGQRAIVCDEESVDAAGRLKLRRKLTPLAPLPALK